VSIGLLWLKQRMAVVRYLHKLTKKLETIETDSDVTVEPYAEAVCLAVPF